VREVLRGRTSVEIVFTDGCLMILTGGDLVGLAFTPNIVCLYEIVSHRSSDLSCTD